jgi:hypothetical protein
MGPTGPSRAARFERLVVDLFDLSSRKYKIPTREDEAESINDDFDIADAVARLPPLPSSVTSMCDTRVDSIDWAAGEARKRSELEAVYVSFALYGEWDPEKMVLPHAHAPTMGGRKFMALCRAAGLLDDGLVTPEAANALMSKHADTNTRLLTFDRFLDAMAAFARAKMCSTRAVLASIRAINDQRLLSIRVSA